jgi:hypothetical protein
MFARLRRRESAPRAAAGNPAPSLRRLAAAAATVIIGMLASAAIVPAAFAEILVPGSGGASGTPGWRRSRPRPSAWSTPAA